ncbi:hypothetical protein DPMN_106041 [Dreissena polymorpha]|uniref:Uncharacterized protein n=1 Tax=Dreissena polymorpha TaxID=45954 RepID=A0A9D4K490_DREPO|nr:hypothetical protein DPMN_106041 [Dreissena polymorpha]
MVACIKTDLVYVNLGDRGIAVSNADRFTSPSVYKADRNAVVPQMESGAHSVKTATHLVATEQAVKMSTNAATVLKDVVMAVKIRLGPIDVHAPTDIY